jgi:alkylation response protein AidB-like acyl-CoA dehydrogenase
MSEPEAGSDLSNVRTRAVRDGDYYVVNGQKIWTTYGHRADMCWLVVRTDPDVPKHRGISLLIVDMKSPGITVQPLIDMAGEHGFNQVLFENVRVPITNRVGAENLGWYILAEHLDFERAGIDRISVGQGLLEECLELVRRTPRPADGAYDVIRQRLAELHIELKLGYLLAYRVAWLSDRGTIPNAEVSMSKAFGTEWCVRMSDTIYKLIGLYGATAPKALREKATRFFLHGVGYTIAAGTSEVQRNIISQRGLGLPRD